MTSGKKTARRGPEPERVKIPGDWEAAVAKALRKPAPKKQAKPKRK